MQAIRLYAENEKWALMLLYAYIATLIKPQFGYLEALAWIVGVWLLYWMTRSVMRWLIFFSCGRHLTAEAIVNQWETDKMPFPAPTYQSAYDYLEDWLAYGQLGNQQQKTAAGWHGILDFLRNIGQVQLLVQLTLALNLALRRYRVKPTNDTGQTDE